MYHIYYLLNFLFVTSYIMSYFGILDDSWNHLDNLDQVYKLFLAIALVFFFNPMYKNKLNNFHRKIAFSAGILLLFTSSISATIKNIPIIRSIPYFNKFMTIKKKLFI